jgi:hypothetical protein
VLIETLSVYFTCIYHRFFSHSPSHWLTYVQSSFPMRTKLFVISLASGVKASTTLFNGDPGVWLPKTTPTTCLQAFNTSLTCDPVVGALQGQAHWVGWNQTTLPALCTSSCRSSLVSLQSTVGSACTSWSLSASGIDDLNATEILDYFIYKFDKTCLQDGSTFCHIQEQSWNIPNMTAAGGVTWPTYTNKTYPDWQCLQSSSFRIRDLTLLLRGP